MLVNNNINNNTRLYADNGDDHHASLQGSYLSALTHYLAMFNTEVVIVVVYNYIIVIVRWWVTRRRYRGWTQTPSSLCRLQPRRPGWGASGPVRQDVTPAFVHVTENNQ